MQKVFVGILTAVMVLTLGTASASAAGPRAGRYFVDADGDGVCDNYGKGCIYADQDGDGVCDNCGTVHRGCMAGTGGGRHFVDADGDGICDNRPAGQARGRGYRGGRGR